MGEGGVSSVPLEVEVSCFLKAILSGDLSISVSAECHMSSRELPLRAPRRQPKSWCKCNFGTALKEVYGNEAAQLVKSPRQRLPFSATPRALLLQKSFKVSALLPSTYDFIPRIFTFLHQHTLNMFVSTDKAAQTPHHIEKRTSGR